MLYVSLPFSPESMSLAATVIILWPNGAFSETTLLYVCWSNTGMLSFWSVIVKSIKVLAVRAGSPLSVTIAVR